MPHKINMKQLLYATDFSDNARQALPFALEIARLSGATLNLMHSIEEPYDFAPMVQEVKKGVTSKVEQLLQELVADIENDPKYAGLTVRTRIQTGRTTFAILEDARTLEADLIIMGSRGRSGLQRFFMGSTSAEVIRRSPIPVLAIPEKASFNGIKNILFAIDYRQNDLQALRYLAALANLFQASITVFHAAPDHDLKNEILFRGFRELAKEIITDTDIIFDLASSSNIMEAIHHKVSEAQPSVVTMVRYDQPFILFGEQYSKEISYSIQRPLLVIPGTNDFFDRYGNRIQKPADKEKGKQPVSK